MKNILKKIRYGVTVFFKNYMSPVPLVFYVLAIASALLYVAFTVSPAFADFFNMNISSIFRMILGKLTSPIPVSLAEALIFTSPIIVFLVIRTVFRYIDRVPHGFGRSVVAIVSVPALLFSIFTLNFAAGYRAPTIDVKLGYETGEVSLEELKETASFIVDKLNELSDEVTFTPGGSVRGYSHSDTVLKAYESYESLSAKYNFINNFKAPVKRLAISPLMTYTHISGMYTFFTGEANLNTNYPEYVNVFTVAHEMAHQRGIARENEANFVAYLVCINSDDSYLRYSGYLSMFEYLTSALSSSSSSYVRTLYRSLDDRVYDDLVAYSNFFDKYSDSVASDVAGTVNDAYLQSQGTPGTKSYGMVVDLAVAHYLNTEKN